MDETHYKKYYKSLIPLGLKYTEIECSFYLGVESSLAWLSLMDHAKKETDISQIGLNWEAQHRYLTWRAQKDPGYDLLKRLFGETLAKDIVKKFLFNGVEELGNKTFLDYFPEYEVEGGSINEKRSIVGKSFRGREDWVFASFMPLNDLYDRNKGYLVNNTCYIEADVAVRNATDKLSYDSKLERLALLDLRTKELCSSSQLS